MKMGIEQEVTTILENHQAHELAQALVQHVGQLIPPNREESETIGRILEDVIRDLPVYEAAWVIFWLGCSWQNLRD